VTSAEVLGYLPPAIVTIAATWLLHKHAGLPVWQALVSVLLGPVSGPAAAGSQLAASASDAIRAARRVTAAARPGTPGRRRQRAWAAAGTGPLSRKEDQ
jgi:hypothetical protein